MASFVCASREVDDWDERGSRLGDLREVRFMSLSVFAFGYCRIAVPRASA